MNLNAPVDPLPAEEDANPGLRKNLRWNYICHALDGGFYVGGMACVATESILPPIVKSLGGPNWLIAFLPQINILGFLLPTLLLAHWVERQSVLKPAVLLWGIPQRLAYLISGLTLLFLGGTQPLATAFIVGLAPFFSGLSFGIMMTGWTELVSRTIPAERRASMAASRNIIAAVLAIAAGWFIKIILEHFPGTPGYAYLHFTAFGLMVISYLILTRLRETPYSTPAKEHHTSFRSNLRSLPAILRSDPSYRHYVFSRMAGSGMWIAMPYITIHILDTTGRPESFLGVLVSCQMAGSLAGNIFGGLAGDRYGGRIVLLLARVCFFISFPLIALVNRPALFLLAFVFLGAGFTLNMVGHSTLLLELPPPKKRPTYVGLASFLNAPPLFLAAVASWSLHAWFSSIAPLLWISLAFIALSFYHLTRIQEPRTASRTG